VKQAISVELLLVLWFWDEVMKFYEINCFQTTFEAAGRV
jgi:hypothetical protein